VFRGTTLQELGHFGEFVTGFASGRARVAGTAYVTRASQEAVISPLFNPMTSDEPYIGD
jgi:hypothetical protein